MEGFSLAACNWILACYAIHLSYGNTIYCRRIKASTIKLYVLAAASLIAQFSTNKIDPRRDNPTSDKFAYCLDAVFKDLTNYEKVPNRREPLTLDMIEALRLRNERDGLPPFHRNVQLYHWMVVGLSLGVRRVEWCQEAARSGMPPDILLPQIDDRDQLPRAFCLCDIECFSVSKARIPLHEAAFTATSQVDACDITFRFQKNGENGEKKRVTRSTTAPQPKHCRIESLMAITRCRLSLAPVNDTIPLAVYQNDSNVTTYITNWDVTGMLRSLAAEVYQLNPNNAQDKENLKRWSSHSIRVGACVLLHAMGFSPTDIKFLLRWKSDAFMTYLRNLTFLSRQHADAIDRAAAIPHFI